MSGRDRASGVLRRRNPADRRMSRTRWGDGCAVLRLGLLGARALASSSSRSFFSRSTVSMMFWNSWAASSLILLYLVRNGCRRLGLSRALRAFEGFPVERRCGDLLPSDLFRRACEAPRGSGSRARISASCRPCSATNSCSSFSASSMCCLWRSKRSTVSFEASGYSVYWVLVDSGESVVIAGRDRIELVVVATGARDGQPLRWSRVSTSMRSRRSSADVAPAHRSKTDGPTNRRAARSGRPAAGANRRQSGGAKASYGRSSSAAAHHPIA